MSEGVGAARPDGTGDGEDPAGPEDSSEADYLGPQPPRAEADTQRRIRDIGMERLVEFLDNQEILAEAKGIGASRWVDRKDTTGRITKKGAWRRIGEYLIAEKARAGQLMPPQEFREKLLGLEQIVNESLLRQMLQALQVGDPDPNTWSEMQTELEHSLIERVVSKVRRSEPVTREEVDANLKTLKPAAWKKAQPGGGSELVASPLEEDADGDRPPTPTLQGLCGHAPHGDETSEIGVDAADRGRDRHAMESALKGLEGQALSCSMHHDENGTAVCCPVPDRVREITRSVVRVIGSKLPLDDIDSTPGRKTGHQTRADMLIAWRLKEHFEAEGEAKSDGALKAAKNRLKPCVLALYGRARDIAEGITGPTRLSGETGFGFEAGEGG